MQCAVRGAVCGAVCSAVCGVRCAVCGAACGVRCGAWCKVQHPLRCTRTSYAQADGLFEPAQQQARDVVGGGTDRNGPPVDRLEDVADAQPCCGGRRALDHADNLDRARARHVAHGHADAAVVCWPLILCEERRVRTRREVACVPVAELGEHRAHSTARLCHPHVVRVGAVATIRARAGVGHACAIELYLRLRYALLMAFQSFPPNCWSTYPRCTTAHASTITCCSSESSAAASAASGGAEVAASASASVRAAWRRVAPAANGSRLFACANLGTGRAVTSGRAGGSRPSIRAARNEARCWRCLEAQTFRKGKRTNEVSK